MRRKKNNNSRPKTKIWNAAECWTNNPMQWAQPTTSPRRIVFVEKVPLCRTNRLDTGDSSGLIKHVPMHLHRYKDGVESELFLSALKGKTPTGRRDVLTETTASEHERICWEKYSHAGTKVSVHPFVCGDLNNSARRIYSILFTCRND